VHMLQHAISVLQGKPDTPEPKWSRREALLVLVHLMGDIHQPLHVGVAYINRDDQFMTPASETEVDSKRLFNTLGGSNFLLDVATLQAGSAHIPPRLGLAPPEENPAHTTRSLHVYWDSTVVDYAMRRQGAADPGQFARALVEAKPAVAPNSGDAAQWPVQWFDESLATSRQVHGALKVGAIDLRTNKRGEQYGMWPTELPADYAATSAELAKGQLTRAGYRLAAVLKAIWP
jgi:hypothetical protein